MCAKYTKSYYCVQSILKIKLDSLRVCPPSEKSYKFIPDARISFGCTSNQIGYWNNHILASLLHIGIRSVPWQKCSRYRYKAFSWKYISLCKSNVFKCKKLHSPSLQCCYYCLKDLSVALWGLCIQTSQIGPLSYSTIVLYSRDDHGWWYTVQLK